MSAVVAPPMKQSIAPMPTERYSEFVRRAHTQLMPQVPDPDRRNRMVWDAWARVKGDPLSQRASELFPPDRYRTVANVCYFAEHSTTSRDGSIARYGVKELGDIIDEHNARADTDAFSAITDGHTQDGLIPGHMQPKVLGYAGPYRLGMIGRENPRFAVFADEHHEINATPVLDRKRRRSVEVNRFRDGRRPYFDPIAALGAESPRLPLPVAMYSESEAEVERYQVMAPAMVSGTNTWIPQHEPIKDRHEQASPQSSSEPQAMDQNPVPEDGQQDMDLATKLVQALQATPEMQWVRKQMQGQQAQETQQQPDGPDALGGDMGQPAPANQMPPQQYGFGAAPLGQPMGNQYMANQYSEQGGEVDRYSQLQDQFREMTDRYAALEEARQSDLNKISVLTKAVAQLEAVKVDADRKDRIRELADQYSISVEDEYERCLYSLGSEMSDSQFDSHLATIEKYAQKRSEPMLPQGQNPFDRSVDKYSEDFHDRVVDYATEKGISWDAAFEELKKSV